MYHYPPGYPDTLDTYLAECYFVSFSGVCHGTSTNDESLGRKFEEFGTVDVSPLIPCCSKNECARELTAEDC